MVGMLRLRREIYRKGIGGTNAMSRKRQWGEDSTIRIDLAAGASVTLSFKGNLFDLTADERRLVSDLSLTVQKYKEGKDEDAKAGLQGLHAAG
jgi:hypothetical protein